MVCFGTPEALIIRSGSPELPRASFPAIAPILSTSILEIRLSRTPDFFINIQSIEYQNEQPNNVGVGVGGGSRNMGGGLSIGLPIGQPKMNRQITIDFIDENGKGLFWQAVSESGFNTNASPEKKEAMFKAIVNKVLSQYPPQK